MPTPFFADLVRELCQEGGTGPLTPTGAVPGHRRLAATVPPGAPFHYAIAGIVHPDQWEVGLGRIDASGRLVRETVATSSSGSAPVDFAVGLKTIALTVAADWFAASDAAQAAQGGALAGKQPLSTLHDSVTSATDSDQIAVRRGAGWVNVPVGAFAFKGAAGTYQVAGPIGGSGGSAGAPGYSFSGDTNTGLYSAAADTLGFATGGAERARIFGDGHVSIGASTSAARLYVRSANSDAMQLIARFQTSNVADTTAHSLTISADPASALVQFQSTGTVAGGFTFQSGGSERMRLTAAGDLTLRTSGTTSTVLGAKAPRLLLQNGASSAGAGGEIVWAGDGDTDDERFAAVSGHVTSNSGAGAVGNLVIATKTNKADTALSPRLVVEAGGAVRPGADNGQTSGAALFRWSVVYAGTGTINTSDEREKTWRGSATAAELRAANRIIAELGFFQWNDAIARKGPHGARHHFGIRAQALWAIMADEGLVDPIGVDGRPGATRYAFLCWDAWPEEGGGNRFGVRPDQLALFLIAAQAQRLATLEAAA